MKRSYLFYLIVTLFLGSMDVTAQERHLFLPVDSLFTLAEHNSLQLAASRKKINITEKKTEIEKQEAWLPEIGASASTGYISNAHVWDNHFNYESTVKMPHTSMNFDVDAGFTVFNGGKTKNSIEKSELEDQIATLDYQKDKESIQLLLLTKYLNLFTLYNQEKIYHQNIELAKHRLSNIQQLIKQGMLTHNDNVRSSLQLTELNMKLTEIKNDINITNHELATVIGIPENTVIDIDSTLYKKAFDVAGISFNKRSLPEIESAAKKIEMADKQIKIEKGARLPQLSLYASDAWARPFLYSIPPVDIYMHYLQAGVRLKYDIGSIYKSKKNIEKARMEKEYVEKEKDWLEQKAEIESHSAFIKMDEAQEKYDSETESFRLAQDNYNVVEQKYLNKFAAITDMLDASTSLLSSQLNLNNARVNIVYRWYNLVKTTGNWEQIKN